MPEHMNKNLGFFQGGGGQPQCGKYPDFCSCAQACKMHIFLLHSNSARFTEKIFLAKKLTFPLVAKRVKSGYRVVVDNFSILSITIDIHGNFWLILEV